MRKLWGCGCPFRAPAPWFTAALGGVVLSMICSQGRGLRCLHPGFGVPSHVHVSRHSEDALLWLWRAGRTRLKTLKVGAGTAPRFLSCLAPNTVAEVQAANTSEDRNSSSSSSHSPQQSLDPRRHMVGCTCLAGTQVLHFNASFRGCRGFSAMADLHSLRNWQNTRKQRHKAVVSQRWWVVVVLSRCVRRSLRGIGSWQQNVKHECGQTGKSHQLQT